MFLHCRLLWCIRDLALRLLLPVLTSFPEHLLIDRVHCVCVFSVCTVCVCFPEHLLIERVHWPDKGSRRPLDEKVAKNFYKSPHLRNTSKQPTMKKIYKRYITMSRISHINWILLIKQRCPGAWVWTWRCPWLYWTFKSFESSVTCCIRIYLKLL